MGNQAKIKIIIADSQFLIARGLASLLMQFENFSVESAVSTRKDLIRTLSDTKAELLITDTSLADDFGTDDLINIRKNYPETRIIILTNALTKKEFAELSSAGFNFMIYKSATQEQIIEVVESALKGKRYFGEEIIDILINNGNSKTSDEKTGKLTSSEIEIVRLIANGLTAKEIASKKNLSIHTVNTHRKNIFRKLKVSNSSELIILAIKAGWIDNIEYYI